MLRHNRREGHAEIKSRARPNGLLGLSLPRKPTIAPAVLARTAMMLTATLGLHEWTTITRRCRFGRPAGYGPARAIYRVTCKWNWRAASCPTESGWCPKRT